MSEIIAKSQKTFLQKVYFEKIKDLNTVIKARQAYIKNKELANEFKDDNEDNNLISKKRIIKDEEKKDINSKDKKMLDFIKKFKELNFNAEEEDINFNVEIENYSDNIIHVFEIMNSSVRSVISSTSIENCISILSKNNISCLPVINPKYNKVIGIITLRDITEHLLDSTNFKQLVSVDGYNSFKNNNFSFFDDPVSKYMKTNIISISPESDISEAAEKMENNHIHRLVVTKNDKLIGIVSSFDIIKAVSKFGLQKYQVLDEY